MTTKTTRLTAALSLACLIAPVAAHAGTRASDSKIVPAASSKGTDERGKGYYSPGPKNGFKDNKGRDIAEIKANDHAAFKRYKSGGC